MRHSNDGRSRQMLEETVEYLRGDKKKVCTRCYMSRPITTFSSIKYGKVRRLISWCKDCVKIGEPGARQVVGGVEMVLVNRGGRVHLRKARGQWG